MARFDVRSAEDYADGSIGRLSLVIGFLIQAAAYVWSAHGSTQLSRAPLAYLGLAVSCLAAIALVFVIARVVRPRLRNAWLIQFARIDNRNFRHAEPSGSELFTFGVLLGFRPYGAEYGDYPAYARRVFRVEKVRDSTKDHEMRPPEFQPSAARDDPHGYVSEQPGERFWWLRSGRG